MQKAQPIISLISAALVLFLAASGFWLSFDALTALAIEVGIEPERAWLYPAIIDGAVIIFSLNVLRTNLAQEKPTYAWVLVSVFTLLSIVLNVIHAEQHVLARVFGAIPPIALFLSFELLMSQIKSISLRWNVMQRLEALVQDVQTKTLERDTLADDIERLETKKQTLRDEIKALSSQKRKEKVSGTGTIAQAREARASKKERAMEQLLDYLDTHPDATLSEMAAHIGRSKSTAGAYVAELQASNRLMKKENGWEVLE